MLIFFALHMAVASAVGQSAPVSEDSLLQVLSQVRTLEEEGRVHEAIGKVEFVLEQSKKLNKPGLTGKAYSHLAELHFAIRNISACMGYAQKALEHCELSYDTLQCLKMHSLVGSVYAYQSNYSEALKNYEEALRICALAGLEGQAVRIRFNMTSAIADMGDYEKALENYLVCIEYFEAEGEEEDMALVQNNMGLLFLEKLNKPEKALLNFQQSVGIYARYDNPLNMARALNNLGLAHSALGNYEVARQNFAKVIEIRSKLNDSGNLAFSLHGMGRLLLKMGKYEDALQHLLKCRDISQQHGIAEGIYHAGLAIGSAYDSLGDRAMAHAYLTSAYNHARESQNLEFLTASLEHLYHHYKRHKQIHQALTSFEDLQKYRQQHDSIVQSNALHRLEIRYANELTSRENELLRLRQTEQDRLLEKETQSKIILYIVLLLMLLLLIFLGISHQQRNRMLKKLTIQTQQLQEQKDKLDEVNESKNRLFSVLSHDLRSPLSSVIGYLDILKYQMDEDDPMTPLLIELQGETRNTLNTLEDLLEWSRIQVSGISLSPTSFDLNRLAGEVTELFASHARHKNININFEPEAESCFAYADEQHIKTVLRNLLSNALKFSPVNGEVVVSTKSSGSLCTLEVKDQGKGISHDELEKIMDPQDHYTSRGTQNEKGTGLGLLLTFEYLHLNRAKLEFTPNKPTGTVASVVLQAAETKISRTA